MSDDPQVHVRHIRTAKLCMSGARTWFSKYDLSWREFVTNGYPASVLEAKDHFGRQVSEIARKEADQ